MGDRLEARISAIENIQEECRHDIREMKEQLARLTSLFKDHIKAEAVYPEVNHHRQINRSLDHSSRLRAICHAKLIAPTCGNQGLQLHRPLGQHLDPLICQAPQKANLMDKSLRRTNHDGTPFPSLTLSCFQSW